MPTPSPADVAPALPPQARSVPADASGTVRGALRSVGAVLELIRWPNALIAAAGVLLGALRAGRVAAPSWLAALAAVALTAVANSVNDLHDREIDRVAHPTRPLPRGAIDVTTATRVPVVATAAALAASFAAAPALGALSTLVVAVMVAYSHSLKPHGLPGNVVVALLASLPFLYGAWSAGRPAAGLALVALAAPLHFAREVAKDLDDAEGDALARRTVPLEHGPHAARAIVVAALGVFVLLAARYFAGAGVAALALLATAMLGVARAGVATLRGRPGVPAILKAAMVVAIAAAAADIVTARA